MLVGEQRGLLCIHEDRFFLEPEIQLIQLKHARMYVYAIVFYVVYDMTLILFFVSNLA
jgi:hypothetical protein